MKMTNLAMAVATTFLASTSAFAAEVYSSDGTSLAIGGYVDVGVGEYETPDKVQVHDVSPRINIEGKKEIGNGITVDAKGEWQLAYLDGAETSFTTRLGYIGATHEQAGRLVVGTQWTPYYDVAGVADKPIAFANNFLYFGQYDFGTARAERMVSYRNSLAVNDDLAFNLGLGWQGEQDNTFDTRAQIALSADFADFSVGYVYNGGDVDAGGQDYNTEFNAISAKYGSYGKGLYVALVYSNTDFDDGYETDAYEALAAFGLDNGLNISLNYEALEGNQGVDTVYSQSAIQAEYTVTSGLVTFVGYQFDLGNDIGNSENDFWTLGARYFF